MLSFPLPPRDAARLVATVVLRSLGGKGSGNFGHAGRPGERGGSATVTVFHGSNVGKKGLDSILSEGIRPTKLESDTPYAWAVSNKKVAQAYAGVDGLIYEAEVPKEAFESFPTRGFGVKYNALRFKGPIRPEWLRAVHSQDKFQGKLTRIKTLGGPGSGNFGHAGRPGEKGGSAPAEEGSSAPKKETIGTKLGKYKDSLGPMSKLHINKAVVALKLDDLEVDPDDPEQVAVVMHEAGLDSSDEYVKGKVIAYLKSDHHKEYVEEKLGKGALSQTDKELKHAPKTDQGPLHETNEKLFGKFEDSGSTPGWPAGEGVIRSAGSQYPTKVSDHYREWATDKLSNEQYNALRGYTGTDYEAINEHLRSPDFQSTTPAIDRIQKALFSAPTPPPPELVWRGLQMSNTEKVSALVKQMQPGAEIELKGFQSTSIKPEFAAGWGDMAPILEIKPKVGAFLRALSSNPSEDEFLLPHGQKYKVVARKRVQMHRTNFSGTKDVVYRNVIQLEAL